MQLLISFKCEVFFSIVGIIFILKSYAPSLVTAGVDSARIHYIGEFKFNFPYRLHAKFFSIVGNYL
jgi:hypothetical protein